MTDAMLAAIDFCSAHNVKHWPPKQFEGEPSLRKAGLGQPITHGQVIALSKCLRGYFQSRAGNSASEESYSVVHDLDGLLRGSYVYREPPKPKKEPTPEFKALMAALREEEEALAYERMMNPPAQPETFSQRFPSSSYNQLFPAGASLKEDDSEVSYAEINRQMALIINVLISIIACSVAIWMAARHWSTPQRLGLSMGGSGVVGIAEVVVYSGYLRRVKEAKEKEKKKPEIKEIIGTWVIDSNKEKKGEGKAISSPSEIGSLRRRMAKKDMVT